MGCRWAIVIRKPELPPSSQGWEAAPSKRVAPVPKLPASPSPHPSHSARYKLTLVKWRLFKTKLLGWALHRIINVQFDVSVSVFISVFPR